MNKYLSWGLGVVFAALIGTIIYQKIKISDKSAEIAEALRIKSELECRLEMLGQASVKVVEISYKRDSILKPLLKRSNELNKKYSTAIDTSLIGDLDSLARIFTAATDRI